jgi:hypothetical protein
MQDHDITPTRPGAAAARLLVRGALAGALALTALPAAAGGGQSILVLDASGSMWGQLEGRTKIEVARDAVDAMLQNWPEDQTLGLIAYGHRVKGDCTDIELLIPADSSDKAALRQQVQRLTPKGMTPISASVRMAAEALKFTEQKATVILVSDGEETCNADPCALGAELEQLGIDFTANVVGFDLPDGKAREQLQCLAQNTGGRYIEARNAGELGAALEAVAAEAPAPEDNRAETQWYLPCVDLYESDYESTDMAPGSTARDCQARCAADDGCDAYTFTKAGWQAEHGKCWLKTGSPLKRNCENCISGAKPGVKVFVEDGFSDPSGTPGCEIDAPASTD